MFNININRSNYVRKDNQISLQPYKCLVDSLLCNIKHIKNKYVCQVLQIIAVDGTHSNDIRDHVLKDFLITGV